MHRDVSDLQDDDPVTLGEASKLLLRGIVSVSALRAEIRRGNLVVEKIGKNLFTTPDRDQEDMHDEVAALNAAVSQLRNPKRRMRS